MVVQGVVRNNMKWIVLKIFTTYIQWYTSIWRDLYVQSLSNETNRCKHLLLPFINESSNTYNQLVLLRIIILTFLTIYCNKIPTWNSQYQHGKKLNWNWWWFVFHDFEDLKYIRSETGDSIATEFHQKYHFHNSYQSMSFSAITIDGDSDDEIFELNFVACILSSINFKKFIEKIRVKMCFHAVCNEQVSIVFGDKI